MKFKQKIRVAIDSPAGAGAGTQAELISKHYNLFYLDTGKIYRALAYFKLKNPKKFNYLYIKKKIKKLKIKDLRDKFGVYKLIWGSDMPNLERFCTYKQGLDYILKHSKELNSNEKEYIIRKNT